MRLTPFQEFKKAARPGTRVPIIGEIPNDLRTPVALYSPFASERFSFLLESAEGGETWGRYSFIGLFPSVLFRSFGRKIEVQEIHRGRFRKRVFESEDPLVELESLLGRYRPSGYEGINRFPGGAVGVVAYDMVRFFEKLPERVRATGAVPELSFLIPRILVIADTMEQTLKIVYDARIDQAGSVASEYKKGCLLIRKVAASIRRGRPVPKVRCSAPRWKANRTAADYKEAVRRVKEYVLAGDVTQTVLSIRFETASKITPFPLYRAVRRVNPSPYLFLLRFGDLSVVGASPETMVHLEEGEMTLRPIAGTRRRGRSEEEDRALEKELLADPKERAEHIMLVDLGRNDLGRVAASGTVRVDELMTIERYSHVMHIVSNVRGRLAEGKDQFDLLRATFPAGTLTGSPKIRAMEIIEELEPDRRGIYGGCAGYFGFNGNMDMAITIRSAVLQKGKVMVQAGAGIVADSDPESEYQECCNKAKAMMEAVESCCS